MTCNLGFPNFADLAQGLSKGCISTEADVWLYDGTLYVSTKASSPKLYSPN